MPIEFRVHGARRLVVARAHGTLTDADVFGYQREVWSRPEVAGFDEIVDMTRVAKIEQATPDRMRQLAATSAAGDPRGGSARLAIVASQDLAFGLGRMYQAHRAMERKSTKVVEVFRTMGEAMVFLGIGGVADPWDPADTQSRSATT